MTIYIGDVHGKYSQYKRIIKEHTNTIQVGDMGVGFLRRGGYRDGDPDHNPPYDVMVEQNARFIRGNHDNPEVCRNHTQWIPDGTIENGTMFIGGGVSIDRQYRIEGYSWWPDEELSQEAFEHLIEVYAEAKPHTMVTHDAPTEIADRIYQWLILPFNQTHIPLEYNRTRDAFQRMLNIHRPKLWVHGHWHVSVDKIIDGTRFVCLAELEVKELK